MADRSSSRKKTKRRAKATNRPELRKSHVAEAGEARAVRDARRRQERAAERARARARSSRRSGIPARPDTTGGLVAMYVAAAVVIGAVALLGLRVHQWGLYGKPESLWLYVLIGAIAAAVPVGFVARDRRDVVGFTAMVAGVSVAAMLLERATFPACDNGASCGAFGALAQWGLAGSLLALVLLTGAAYALANIAWLLSGNRRPAGIATGPTDMAWGMLMPLLLVGVPLTATLVFVDAWARPAPGRAITAVDVAARECFSDFASTPDLVARPALEGSNPQTSNFLVRRVGEHRGDPYTASQLAARRSAAKGTGGGKSAAKVPTTHPFTGSWLDRLDASPYEAAVGIDSSGRTALIECRLIAGSDIATAADVAPLSQTDLESGAQSLSTNGFTFDNAAASQFLKGNDAKGTPFAAAGANSPAIQAAIAKAQKSVTTGKGLTATTHAKGGTRGG